MNCEERINEILNKCMSEKGIIFWGGLKSRIPPVWDRPASSSGKYHLDEDGHVHSINEHTYEMLHAASKLIRMFGVVEKSYDADIILLSVLLHDSLKYGKEPQNRPHTDNKHDQLIGDVVMKNKAFFMQLYSEEQVNILEESVRYHSGKWSTDLKSNGKVFDSKGFNFQTLTLHILDMLSTNNCLRVPSNGNSVLRENNVSV